LSQDQLALAALSGPRAVAGHPTLERKGDDQVDETVFVLYH
jgi:hypothetical protein